MTCNICRYAAAKFPANSARNLLNGGSFEIAGGWEEFNNQGPANLMTFGPANQLFTPRGINTGLFPGTTVQFAGAAPADVWLFAEIDFTETVGTGAGRGIRMNLDAGSNPPTPVDFFIDTTGGGRFFRRGAINITNLVDFSMSSGLVDVSDFVHRRTVIVLGRFQ